jgi:hypothetical protein
LKGFEIQVRGPFDVSDKNKSFQVPASPISPTTPTSPTKSAKSSLINPDSEDGCWDELFMICGGTGITPMLQVRNIFLLRIHKNFNLCISFYYNNFVVNYIPSKTY